MKPLRIYIAGPYSGSDFDAVKRNVCNAIDAGIKIFKKGHYPYVPHLTHLIKERADETGCALTWHDFIRWDMPWIDVCDALLLLDRSPGADLELERAKNIGKVIYYAVDDIPNLSNEKDK